MIASVALVLLTLTPRTGMAPVPVKARVEVKPAIVAGMVCVEGESELAALEDCWPVGPEDRTRVFWKTYRVSAPGDWTFYVVVAGQGESGRKFVANSGRMVVTVIGR